MSECADFFEDDLAGLTVIDAHDLIGEERSFRIFVKERYQHWVYGQDWRGGISGRRRGIKNHTGKVEKAFKLFRLGWQNKAVASALNCCGTTVQILRRVYVDHTGHEPLCRCGRRSDHSCRCPFKPGPARRIAFGNRALTIQQWSKELGIPRHRIYTRLYRGLPTEKVLSPDNFQGDALRRHPKLPTTVPRPLPPELPPEAKRLHWRKRRRIRAALMAK